MTRLSWKLAAAAAGTALVAGGAAAPASARSAPAQPDTTRTVTSSATAPDGSRTTLRITMAKGAKLSSAQKSQLSGLTHTSAKQRAPYTLRCGKNPTWNDPRGSLSARFNCRHSTINWGFRIGSRVKAVITGPVHEQGVSWWRNGKRQPRNAGHVVGKNYHFHGTLKPVKHGDHVQFQDYMKFPVRIGGKPGTGTLTWALDVRAKK